MTITTRGTSYAHLLAVLSASIGRQSAVSELTWMKQTLQKGFPKRFPRLDLEAMVHRRAKGEPLQYILGTQPFGPLNLLVRPPVLIPRPETEDWTIKLTNFISPTPRRPVSVLDLCTGSGCIPLLLCHLWPPGSTRAYGVDISPDAIQLAKDNAVECGIPMDKALSKSQNVFTPYVADIRDDSFMNTLKLPYDLITSNPPCIPRREYDELHPSVKNFEDPRALLGDPPDTESRDGLSFYRFIAQLVSQKETLSPDGLVALEVGEGQAEVVQKILRERGGMRKTDIWLDPWGNQRVVIARA